MMQLDMFAEPKAPPSESEPTVFRIEDKNSDATIVIAPNPDATWGFSTNDHYYGYCGHCGPIHGSYPSFLDALDEAIRRIDSKALSVQTDRSSCCGEKHRAFAAKVRAWVKEIEAEHFTSEWLASRPEPVQEALL